MTYGGQISVRQRTFSASAALLVAIAVGIGLASGLDLDVVRKASETISAIAIPASPKPRKEPAQPFAASDRASGKASPASRQAKAAPVAVSESKLPPIDPPLIATAAQPGSGSDASAGATPKAGPGSGAGGQGGGTGAGGLGNGGGGGTRPAWRSGQIKDSDYPRGASRAKIGGTVEVRFTIQPNGHVSQCRITRSTGDASLDATTCRLIEERFRFKPATDDRGNAIASDYGWRQEWWLEQRR